MLQTPLQANDENLHRDNESMPVKEDNLTGQQAPEKQVMMPEDSASGEGCTGEESAA